MSLKRSIPQPSTTPAPEAKTPAAENVVRTAASAATETKIGLPVGAEIARVVDLAEFSPNLRGAAKSTAAGAVAVRDFDRIADVDAAKRIERLHGFAEFMGLEVRVGADSDQPGMWHFKVGDEGSDISYNSELEAWRTGVGSCQIDAMLSSGGWTLPVDARLDPVRGLMCNYGGTSFDSTFDFGDVTLTGNSGRVLVRVQNAPGEKCFRATEGGMKALADFLDAEHLRSTSKEIDLCEKNGIALAHAPGNEKAWDWTHSSGASAHRTFDTMEAAAKDAVQTLELDRKVPSEEWIYSGAEVFWTDPDDENDCSCYGNVVRVHTEGPITEDSIVIVHRNDGTDMECFASELS